MQKKLLAFSKSLYTYYNKNFFNQEIKTTNLNYGSYKCKIKLETKIMARSVTTKRISSFRKLAWFQYWFDGEEYLAYASDDGIKILAKGKDEVFLPWAVVEELVYWIKWKLEIDLGDETPPKYRKVKTMNYSR